MSRVRDVIGAIGGTPMIKLKRASDETGCTILGKAEFMNPGQSVKDRAGKWMILEAEKRGDLKPGGLVVFTLKVPRIDSIEEPNELFRLIVAMSKAAGLRLFAQTHLTYNRHEFTLFLERD